METGQALKESIDVVLEYTKQFIDAATPIAKQAYEVGLLTLQIDALQSLLFAAVTVGLCAALLLKIRKDYMAAAEKAQLPENKHEVFRWSASDHLPMTGAVHFLGGLFAAAHAIWSIYSVASIWLWVKLFSPELWLAHQAIEKVIKQ